MGYLQERWLGRGWVHVSQGLRAAVVGRVYEIYANAFEHGISAVGLFSCGQHYPKKKLLKLSVVDFGVGIPSNVRVFLNDEKLAPDKAMEWAFRSGTTTQPNGLDRGIGLDLLRQLLHLNKGQLSVYSHDGYAIMDSAGMRFGPVPNFFEGTLVNLTLVCDDQFYCLASEIASDPLF